MKTYTSICLSLIHNLMGDFKTWLESADSRRITSVEEAQSLSSSTALDTSGIEFNLIEQALARKLPVTYENVFPLAGLAPTPAAGDMGKLLQMLGAFAQAEV